MVPTGTLVVVKYSVVPTGISVSELQYKIRKTSISSVRLV